MNNWPYILLFFCCTLIAPLAGLIYCCGRFITIWEELIRLQKQIEEKE